MANEKPFILIDNSKIRITDLQNGSSEFLFKETGETIIYTNDEIRASIAEKYSDKYIGSIKHKVGATRDYHE